jgi:hypothetical protein
MVGIQLRGQSCGPDMLTRVRSELGFGVKWLFPSKSSRLCGCTVDKRLAYGQPRVLTPVDPAGPHCYRDGTKTC